MGVVGTVILEILRWILKDNSWSVEAGLRTSRIILLLFAGGGKDISFIRKEWAHSERR